MNAMVMPRTTSRDTKRRIAPAVGAVVVVTVLLVTEVAMQGGYQAVNLASMRGSVIWFVVASAWVLDSILAFFRHNRSQAGLTLFFAACFLVIGLIFRK